MNEHKKRLIDEKFTSAADRNNAYRRLEAREPLAYILGEWYFYGETYHVTPDVLIPRSDTEILVEAAIRRIPRGGVFADLCTGSGCIAVSVLCHRSDLTAAAVDISDAALKIAQENAVKNGVGSRIEFINGDITSDGFAESLLHNRTFDALLSNPPYIMSGIIDKLEREVLAEPLIALDGGHDGLCFYRTLKQLREKILKSDGITILEIGYDQAEQLLDLFRGGEILKDYGGNNRVFII